MLNEPMCDFSILIRIARIRDEILEVKESQRDHHSRRNCDGCDDRGILGVLACGIKISSTQFVDVPFELVRGHEGAK
jgi:hypothetical protein